MKIRVFLLLAAALAVVAYFVFGEDRHATLRDQHADESGHGVAADSNADARHRDHTPHEDGNADVSDPNTIRTHVHENTVVESESVSVRTTVGIVDTKKSISLPLVDAANIASSDRTVARNTAADDDVLPGSVANDAPMASLEPGSQALIHSGGPLDGRGQDPLSSGVGPAGTGAGQTVPPVDIDGEMPGPGAGGFEDAAPSLPNFELPDDTVEDPDGDAPN